MKLLIQPPPFENESLESYLLRLAKENLFSTYEELSKFVWSHLKLADIDAAGAFPRELEMVNIYHVSRRSAFRVRAIQLFEQLAEIETLPLLSKAMLNSNIHFPHGLAAVSRTGITMPKCFLRVGGIPVCPNCLNESAYIRQYWHFIPYTSCHIHRTKLIERCPECNMELNYQASELVDYCECGFDLKLAKAMESTQTSTALSHLVTAKVDNNATLTALMGNDVSMRFGALIWYYLYRQFPICDLDKNVTALEEAIDYFQHWPSNYYQWLDEKVERALLTQTRKLNRTTFKNVFGGLLLDCRQLPSRDLTKNFIARDTIQYFVQLVRDNPKGTSANIADVLLTAIEAATLLTTTKEQVYRLYQDGFLSMTSLR